ncbi:MAG: hypothetical protein KDA84_11920, partial [Planctomycetaceae bacterium]|nr:hypothetical protein [Planctomycetaceae bacterium]
EKPEESSSSRQTHFAYVLENGRVLSPEFENASEALTDFQAKHQPAAEPDLLPKPPTVDSRTMLGDIDLSVPLPKNTDLLNQPETDALSENVVEGDPTDPNAVLLLTGIGKKPAPQSEPKPKLDPLTVDDVMELLNKEKNRRASQGFRSVPPPATYFLGHPNPTPAKTVKVIQFP